MKTTFIVLVVVVAALLGIAGASCTGPVRTIVGEGEGEGEGGGEGEGEGEGGEGEGGEGEGGEGEGEGAAGCTTDQDCATNQLCQNTTCTCDVASGFCVPQQASCTSNDTCTQIPGFDVCNLQSGQCELGTCINGGVQCDPSQNCAQSGQCLTGSALPCTTDDQCTDLNEYCNVELGAASGGCATGCRSDGDCNNQVCSGGHTCVDSAGAFGAACADGAGSPDDTLCAAGLFCGQFSKTCQESCSGGPQTCSGGNCCVASGLGCCNQFGFCSAQGC